MAEPNDTSSTSDRQQKVLPVAAVTGANGYVGSIVVDALTAEGFQVRRLVRQPKPGSEDRFFELTASCSQDALEGVDTLIHCAYDLSATTRTSIWEANVFGTRALFDLALRNNVRRTILISSMSAYAGTTQIYGRSKLASESDAFARGMCAVRPGLVYGPGWGGMAGTLKKLVSLPVIPVIGRHAHQFTVHEDDLRNAIVKLAMADTVPIRPLGLANPEYVPFEDLLRTISLATGRSRSRFISIPWQLLYATLRIIECTPIKAPVRADSILGLVKPAQAVPNLADLVKLGIGFRKFGL